MFYIKRNTSDLFGRIFNNRGASFHHALSPTTPGCAPVYQLQPLQVLGSTSMVQDHYNTGIAMDAMWIWTDNTEDVEVFCRKTVGSLPNW